MTPEAQKQGTILFKKVMMLISNSYEGLLMMNPVSNVLKTNQFTEIRPA